MTRKQEVKNAISYLHSRGYSDGDIEKCAFDYMADNWQSGRHEAILSIRDRELEMEARQNRLFDEVPVSTRPAQQGRLL